MKNELLRYKGYIGSIEPDIETGHLYGKVLFINDLITYTADTLLDLKKEFEISVDEYLAYCAEVGDEPNKSMTGSLNVRIGPENHRKLAYMAVERDVSINDLIKTSVEQFLAGENNYVKHIHEHVHKVSISKEIETSYSQGAQWSQETESTEYNIIRH